MVESFPKLLIVEIVWKLYFNRNTPPSSFYFLSINGLRRVNATLRLQFFFSTRFALLHRVCVCVFFYTPVVGTSYFKNSPPIFSFFFYDIYVYAQFYEIQKYLEFFNLIYFDSYCSDTQECKLFICANFQ